MPEPSKQSNLPQDVFDHEGRVWFRDTIPEEELVLFDRLPSGDARPGARLTFDKEIGCLLGRNGSLMRAVAQLNLDAFATRAVAFNKSQDANWRVRWHQDRVIAVQDRVDVPGFWNWSKKSGVWHCEPPSDVLQDILFVRVHLDDTNAENGAMQIALGSHKAGVIRTADAAVKAEEYPIETCEARRGDVLVLKMLTLHCSDPSVTSAPRRALRVDFATRALPAPLGWVPFRR